MRLRIQAVKRGLKRVPGVTWLVAQTPSRRYMRELRAENGELTRERKELRRVVTLAEASADSVLQASAVCRRNRL